MEMEQILKEAVAYQTNLVEVTGGEPLLQAACASLLTQLCDLGKQVLLETSGERDISVVDIRVHRIVDFKAPASGESHRNRWDNIDHLNRNDEVKLVIQDRNDYEWAKSIIREHALNERVKDVWLSPVHGVMPADALVTWMLKDELKARVQLQIHKYIWGPNVRGV